MKKLINDPKHVVREMLEGMVALMPGCALLENENVIVRHPLPQPDERLVAVISGGGSGHEPAHAGYVGAGMLSAAVAGDVFTSPSADAVLSAIKTVAGSAGAVLIVKNYTGDRLNFGLAAELAQANGIPIEIVVVADDVALRTTVEKGRRRGIAGTVFIHKIAGAAAEAGKPLAEVARLAREAASHLGSFGVALSGCTLPAVAQPGFILAADEIELGLGIHGEKGVSRAKLQESASMVREMLEAITQELSLQKGERVVLLVNGLGATPPMELAIVNRDAVDVLRQIGVQLERVWCGTFLSALDMAGCSLSLLRVDDARLALLDAATNAPAWTSRGLLNEPLILPNSGLHNAVSPPQNLQAASGSIRRFAFAAAKALVDAEKTLTDLDSRAGDGDLGISLSRGAESILNLPDAAWNFPAASLAAMANAVRRAIGGSSGPFYATALLRASRTIGQAREINAEAWAMALQNAVEAIAELGGARPGDRTMLDALAPAAVALLSAVRSGSSAETALAECAAAAERGAQATASMEAKMGRASYLGERASGVADGGAIAVSIWLKALHAELLATPALND